MKTIKWLLPVLLAGTFAVGARAQDGTPMPDFPTYVPDEPLPPMVPAHTANPKFPLQVEMLKGRWSYSGNHEYKGSGVFNLAGVANQDFSYRYSCAYSFRVRHQIYQARWITPGKKLEILMSKPGSQHTNPCRLSTTS